MELLPGDVVTIYKDWENEKEPLGEAILVKQVSEGLTFILEDTYPDGIPIPDHIQEVYKAPKWVVDFINLTPQGRDYYGFYPPVGVIYKVRYLYNVGLTAANNEESPFPKKRIRLEEDKFISINGKPIY